MKASPNLYYQPAVISRPQTGHSRGEVWKRDASWLTRDRKRESCPHDPAGVKITITVLLLNRLSQKHVLLISRQFQADCLGCRSVGRGGHHLPQKAAVLARRPLLLSLAF